MALYFPWKAWNSSTHFQSSTAVERNIEHDGTFDHFCLWYTFHPFIREFLVFQTHLTGNSIKVCYINLAVLPRRTQIHWSYSNNTWYLSRVWPFFATKDDTTSILIATTAKSVLVYFKISHTDSQNQLNVGQDRSLNLKDCITWVSANALTFYWQQWSLAPPLS